MSVRSKGVGLKRFKELTRPDEKIERGAVIGGTEDASGRRSNIPLRTTSRLVDCFCTEL